MNVHYKLSFSVVRYHSEWPDAEYVSGTCNAVIKGPVTGPVYCWWNPSSQLYLHICHLPYGITQCYLSPDTSRFTPS